MDAVRDLDQAEHWYRRSLELYPENDRLGRGRSTGALGGVAYEQFLEAREAKRSEDELLKHLKDAQRFYLEALGLIPGDAVDDLAVTHNQLGLIYHNANALDPALYHYRESIRYKGVVGDVYGAATTRFNVALVLARAGRFEDALDYAVEALRNYQSYGDNAAEDIQKTQQLIAGIEEDIKKQERGPHA